MKAVMLSIALQHFNFPSFLIRCFVLLIYFNELLDFLIRTWVNHSLLEFFIGWSCFICKFSQFIIKLKFALKIDSIKLREALEVLRKIFNLLRSVVTRLQNIFNHILFLKLSSFKESLLVLSFLIAQLTMIKVHVSLLLLFPFLFCHCSLIIIVKNLLLLSIQFLQVGLHQILLLFLLISHHSFSLFLPNCFKLLHLLFLLDRLTQLSS